MNSADRRVHLLRPHLPGPVSARRWLHGQDSARREEASRV